jgi:2-amino-4-hydroxy-6-hydroxymethyldihydropteridine diphosphokinase
LDLLYFGNAQISDDRLQLPHPRMHERRFVLEPLRDIRPELVLPLQTETVAALLTHLPETPPLVRVASEW